MNQILSIMVVDDDDVLRSRLEKAFLKRGYMVYIASNRDEALNLAAQHHPNRAVLDLKMPGKSGSGIA